jgi:hypothetical protein|uniref:Portal n=1 Tax=Myoviridae sp. ct8Uw4 TaxID=2825040 RepID=A0A8S5P113_9CAUD|nr:MAG TPA: portal [Myoviridae sp. ct8Uw4]
MFGLIKGKKRQAAVKYLTAATEDALSNMFADMTGNDTLLARLGVGRQYAFDAVYADDEVAACAEDLRAAMLAKPWRLYGDGLSEEDKDRLWKMLRQHMGALAETVLDARLNGYGVARYVYAQGDDGIRIANVSSKRGELERFIPYRDGSLMYRGTAGEEVCDTNVMYLFLTHRATSTNPAGEMAAARLYAPVALRSKGFVFAAQFITRYSQPYMVAKINAGTDEEHRGFMRRFIDFLGGGAVSIEREDDVKMLQNTADGQAFKRLENLANARIQKNLLGKVKTSDLETGSRAAQETEENNRAERIASYLAMLSRAAQHFVDAAVMVNNAYGRPIHAPKGVWFEFEDEVRIDKTRAERDKMYLDAGQLVLTEEYYRDVLGFEESHFKLREPPAVPQQTDAKMSLRLSDGLARNAPDTAEQAIARPKMEAVLGLLESCKDYAEFEAKLSELDLGTGDNLLIQRLVSDGLAAWADGANDGRN